MEDRGVDPRRAYDTRFNCFGRMIKASARVRLGLLNCRYDQRANVGRLVRVFVAPDRDVARFLRGVEAHVIWYRHIRVRCAMFQGKDNDLRRHLNY